METKEMIFKGFKMNGFLALFLHLIVFSAVIVYCFITATVWSFTLGALGVLVWLILCAGYMQLEPNEARALVFSENIRVRSRRRDSSLSTRLWTRRNCRFVPATLTWNPSR